MTDTVTVALIVGLGTLVGVVCNQIGGIIIAYIGARGHRPHEAISAESLRVNEQNALGIQQIKTAMNGAIEK